MVAQFVERDTLNQEFESPLGDRQIHMQWKSIPHAVRLGCNAKLGKDAIRPLVASRFHHGAYQVGSVAFPPAVILAP